MAYRILILGASYGSLLGTKFLMAGHDVTLVCRARTAELINAEGTDVRIKLRGEADHRSIRSADQPGRLDACTPDAVEVANYDLVGLAMQEPQYGAADIRALLERIARARLPCLSIMNMPPLPYLRRIPGLDATAFSASYSSPEVWEAFVPELVTLCSPDPQAYRPPDEKPNVLHVGLPTNFKAAEFGDDAANGMLASLAADIDAVRLDGKDVPVKLRIFPSLFVPMAKWSMLLAGNYRCITRNADARPIRDAVLGDRDTSREIYAFVDDLARQLGADPDDLVPFEKYAAAAEQLANPSSVARAVSGGATEIERVDKLVQTIGRELDLSNEELDRTVETVDMKLAENRRASAPAT
jgi:ketopantoate reductase